jgi:hypothetical protein
VSTPPFAAGPRVHDEKLLGERLYSMFRTSLAAAQGHPDAAIDVLFVHLDGLGLDRFPESVVVEAFRRAIAEPSEADR